MQVDAVGRVDLGRIGRLLVCTGLLASCADDPPPAPTTRISGPQLTCVRGMLSTQGVECPLFIAGNGASFSLMGDVAWLRPGLQACVCGDLVQVSFCQQGRPLTVAQIGAVEDCPAPRKADN